jgi:hypothetical protein
MHATEAKRVLGTRIPWLIDTMDNDLKHALGNTPNAELVFDPDGKIVRRRGWSDPDALRQDLAQLTGPADKVTRVEDLDLPVIAPAKTVAKGVVPRVEVPPGMRALRIEATTSEDDLPYYVKLRAEGNENLIDTGQGVLFVGFHLDPLYKVHWNNDAPPLTLEVRASEGGTVTPSSVVAPDPEEPADADPREFLLEVDAAGQGEKSLELSVRYFACDDAQTFCIPVNQRYSIWLERDPDGGSVHRERKES